MDPIDVEDLLDGLDDTNIEEEPALRAPDIDPSDHIDLVYKSITKIYGLRVPGDLKLTPQQYLACIDILQNDPCGDAKSREQFISKLNTEVGKDTALKVAIGLLDNTQLSDEDWSAVQTLADELRELLIQDQQELEQLTEKAPHMCPNLCALVTPAIAAQLLKRQSGEDKLNRLGQTQPSNFVNPINSPLAQDELISSVPPRLQKQSLRVLAGKAVLAARIDSLRQDNSTQDSSQGQKWRREVEKRIDQLLAPPPSVQHRALPKPLDKPKQRRGGQRMRKYKQKRAPTELQNRQNVLRFGDI